MDRSLTGAIQSQLTQLTEAVRNMQNLSQQTDGLIRQVQQQLEYKMSASQRSPMVPSEVQHERSRSPSRVSGGKGFIR